MTPQDLPIRFTRRRGFARVSCYTVWLAGRRAGSVSATLSRGQTWWHYAWSAPDEHDQPYLNHQARTRDAAVRGAFGRCLREAAWLAAWCEAGP